MRLNRPPNKRINVRPTWKCQSQDSSTAELLGKWGLHPSYAVDQEGTLNYCVFDKTSVWCVKSTSSDPHTIREGTTEVSFAFHVATSDRKAAQRRRERLVLADAVKHDSRRCTRSRRHFASWLTKKKQPTKLTSTAWHDSELGYWLLQVRGIDHSPNSGCALTPLWNLGGMCLTHYTNNYIINN